MNPAFWRDLAVTTIKDPAQAARRLMALGLGREVLWLGLALAVVLNTLLQAASNLLLPVIGVETQGIVPSLIAYSAIVGGGLIVTILAFYHVGRALGGTGSFNDVMILMVWMQFLKVAVQAAGLILVLTIPILSALLAFAAFLIGIYISVHFIDQAHRLNSLSRAAGVLIASVLAIAVVSFILLSLVGGPIPGSVSHV
ncbi:YIP1 family protein [Ruegeria sediminis]|uniref:YIP1 family protein n=1 Tax=Ruegeria sediminis TaxID=2583820 RepID=A0ABY2WZW2_9RHOB|nr:Yip1 family protein [Ruegeria sediminis]TMV08528.1 YIP1 family protein [Ruegeria sediminis]